jgi:hypothetical protein
MPATAASSSGHDAAGRLLRLQDLGQVADAERVVAALGCTLKRWRSSVLDVLLGHLHALAFAHLDADGARCA